ncbi:MAG: sporulation protein YqfD [Clostridiales bacterium]|nr:sporulation protein YqfD [Clostridiales bacterium]
MGKYPERLVNRCISEGISLTNCERTAKGLIADIPIRDFRSLRRLKRGCECRVRILSKRGLPMAGKAIRHNAVFAAGFAICLAAALFLSTRLWFITVDSNSVPPAEVEKTLADIGVSRGVPRRDIATSAVTSVLNADRRILNAKVVLAGVRLKVTVSDALAPMEGERNEAPADLVAERDCVISYVSVLRGHAEVKPGQAVRAGDILIRGDLSQIKEGYAVRAEGLVYGRLLYRVSAHASAYKRERVRSGRSARLTIPQVFGFELKTDAPFAEYELVSVTKEGFTCSIIPVWAAEYEAYELKEASVRDTAEGTEERARLAAQEKLKKLVPEGAKIVSVKTECITERDGSVTAVITVTTVEKIGTHRGI